MKNKQKYKINKGRLALFIIALFLIAIVISGIISFVKYPEQYLPTWKREMAEELFNGNQEMLEYYNRNYVANGKYLFGDKYIIEEDYLNLATVVDFDTTESGLMLYTNDGNGYYIAR